MICVLGVSRRWQRLLEEVGWWVMVAVLVGIMIWSSSIVGGGLAGSLILRVWLRWRDVEIILPTGNGLDRT
jgi:hypothetical protein